MDYKYIAYTPQSKIVKGTLKVPTKSMAIESLERSGLKVLSLRKAREWNASRLLPSSSSVKARDIILFSRQLAMLLERGTGFITALQLSLDQTSSQALRKILEMVIEDVREGSTLSSAIAKHPRVFPLAYTRMVMLGEQTGRMEATLRELASNMEKDEAAKKKVRSALTYPAFLLVLGIITAVVMMTAVLPSITRLFDEFDAELPWNTRMVISIGDFFTDFGYYLLGGICLLFLILVWYIRQPSGRYNFEKLALKLPLVGRIILSHNMRSYSQMMATLLKSGLPMTEVMAVARQSASGELMRQTLAKIPDNLLQGQSLSQTMRADKFFPDMLVQMTATGEETNTLDDSFAAVADHYEAEFDETMASAMTVLEPVMLVVIGLLIGFVAVSVIMPIYSVYNVIS